MTDPTEEDAITDFRKIIDLQVKTNNEQTYTDIDSWAETHAKYDMKFLVKENTVLGLMRVVVDQGMVFVTTTGTALKTPKFIDHLVYSESLQMLDLPGLMQALADQEHSRS